MNRHRRGQQNGARCPLAFTNLLIFAGHNVRHTQVCQDNSADAQKIVEVLLHNGLVKANGLSVLVLHEKDVGHI